MKTYCISNPELSLFLKREPRAVPGSYDLDLQDIFCDILKRANDFLPSEAGTLFLADPISEEENPGAGELVAIACFGETASELVGLGLFTDTGIVGHVYRTGEAYVSAAVEADPLFFDGLDRASGFTTHSIVCAPLRVEGRAIGVLELVNYLGDHGYTARDLELLEIFAQTISALVSNSIEAQRSKEMSKRDELTGLYNDRYLHYSLERLILEALRSGSDCGLIFLDLDHFKSINDCHGHLVGSRVLAEVGFTLRQIVPGHAIASRYGGDEFVIALPGAEKQEVFWVAETVRKNIESAVFLEQPDPLDPVNYPGLRLRGIISCSIGIATLRADVIPRLGPAPGQLAAKSELMRRADSSMYRAKQLGRNLTVVTEDCAG